MNRIKKNKTLKNKLMLSAVAVAMPIAATVASAAICPIGKASADSTASRYYSSYIKEVSMTNNNFNSSSSTYSLSTSLSGWTGKYSSAKTTAGIINTGTSFQNYMTGTYHLSKNPQAKAADSSILMINSKTSETGKNEKAKQGYSSNKVTLSANSYYSFQVSFKTDTNYSTTTTYVESGVVGVEDKTITKTTFESKAFSLELEPVYVEYKIGSSTFYIQKRLTANTSALSTDQTFATDDIFYEDENFVGFKKDTEKFYVRVSDTQEEDGTITVSAGTTTYSCNLAYNEGNKTYAIDSTEKYYSSKTEYVSLNDYIFGSIYLSGLKDADGKQIKADFTEVTSKEWVTFYFFVATGDTEQETTLDLWLGADKEGYLSGGAVFFDDCHIFQYSENAFWKTYNNYAKRNYVQESTNGEKKKVDCTKLYDLRNPEQIVYDSHNFDFEDGVIEHGVSNWKTSGTGKARIYNTASPTAFKSSTGYDFVGSNLSCKVDMENESVSISKNDYVLGLSAKKQYVKVTSNEIMVEANSIYKIKAYYKISELSSGNVYMFVEETDSVLNAYGLNKDNYKVLAQTASGAITSNGSDQFKNNYGTVEFFVKGGALYNSAVKVSLGLGSETENATGCVVFDDITVTKASSSEFESASNKASLNSETSATLSVTNGEFNEVSIDKDGNHPLSPNGWTINSSKDLTFGGVINSSQEEYEKYVAKYNNLASTGVKPAENPYYWASYGNKTVGNRFENTTDTDNILMLANCKETWQNVKTPNLSISANSFNKISFWYNTASEITVTLYDNNGFKLSKEQKLSSGGVWESYDIFLKAGNGASEVYLLIELGTEKDKKMGFAYFDHFTLDNKITEEEFKTQVDKKNNTIDMSNFYLNLPSNNITTDVNPSATPAYEGKVVAGDGGSGSVVNSDKFKESENFKIETEEPTNVFYLQNQTAGTYALQSKFNLDLASGYYKLSFKLKTHFEGTLDAKKKYKYGVSIGLTGFEYMSQLKSEENYEEYSIFFHPTDTTTAQLYISLVSDTNDTIGAAAIYDLNFVEVKSEEFDLAKSTCKDKKYDVNKAKVFVATKNAETETPDDPENPDKPNETNPSNGGLNWSILISSILMGAAILIAVIGVVLRNVKLKKIEKRRKESYDRKSSLEVDVVKAKAKTARDEEIVEIQKNVDRFQKELDNLEAKHKEKIVGLRSHDKDEVSKQTDKEFKDFARKRTAVAEKIDSLKKQIENVKSPEYLLELERKIYAEEIARKRQIEKASRKQNAKAEKSKAKEEKTSKKSK